MALTTGGSHALNTDAARTHDALFAPFLFFISLLPSPNYALGNWPVKPLSICAGRQRNLRLHDHRHGAPVGVLDRGLPHRGRAPDVERYALAAQHGALRRREEIRLRFYGPAAIAGRPVRDRARRAHEIRHRHQHPAANAPAAVDVLALDVELRRHAVGPDLQRPHAEQYGYPVIENAARVLQRLRRGGRFVPAGFSTHECAILRYREVP